MEQYNQNNPQQSLAEAAIVCKQLGHLVAEENSDLEIRKVDKVEEKLKQKSRLSDKLQRLLQDVKTNKDVIKNDPNAKLTAVGIQEDMDAFQKIARKNLLLLKSAHQTRADTLQVIRHAMNHHRPQVETYNASGVASKKGKEANLVNKAV